MERPNTAQLLARVEQTSDDELLARVIAMEEDEKYARKLQKDLEAGLDPPIRPYSALRQTSAKSETALNTLMNDDIAPRPLTASQYQPGSRELMSNNNISSRQIPQRRESISRSGGLHNLTLEETASDPSVARAAALKGSVPVSTVFPHDLTFDDSAEGSESASSWKQRAGAEGDQQQDYGTTLLADSPTGNVHDKLDIQKRQETREEQQPQRKGTRPESARRSVPRHHQLNPEESDEGDDLDMYINSTTRAHVEPRIDNKNPWPLRSDSLQRQEDDSTQNIFPEAARSQSDANATSRNNSEIEELFTYISGYQPQEFELTHQLKPFLPDYIPSIGDIDAMIKIPPPVRYPDEGGRAVDPERLPELGIKILDEPSVEQSDPAVLDLRLRALQKTETAAPSSASARVRSIQLGTSQQDGKKALTQWVHNVYRLHVEKPQDKVDYAKKMPEIENLMKQWPTEIDHAFESREIAIPPADIDLPLRNYAQLACNCVDIPVHRQSEDQPKKAESRAHIEALHVLFTLYAEFKNSQHFGHRER